MNEQEAQEALEKRQFLMEKLGEAYLEQLDDQMGLLHNQFETFISASQLPLPQVILVLQMLISETVELAHKRYLTGAQ